MHRLYHFVNLLVEGVFYHPQCFSPQKNVVYDVIVTSFFIVTSSVSRFLLLRNSGVWNHGTFNATQQRQCFWHICDIEQICKFRHFFLRLGFITRLKVSSRCRPPSPIVFNSKKSHLWRHCDVIFLKNLVFVFRNTKPPHSLMFRKLFNKTFFMKNKSEIDIICNDVIIYRSWRHHLSLMTSSVVFDDVIVFQGHRTSAPPPRRICRKIAEFVWNFGSYFGQILMQDQHMIYQSKVNFTKI